MKLRRAETLGLLALVATASPYAIAADAYRGLYIGGNVGWTNADIFEERRLASRFATPAFGATAAIGNDDDDLGYKLYGGYRFNRNFALEGGYFNLGDYSFTATSPAGALRGNAKVHGINLDAVGILPITDTFSAFARAGVTRVTSKESFSGSGIVFVPVPRREERDFSYKIGVGLQYDFSPAFGVRGEVERYRVWDIRGTKGDIDMFSLGLVWRFGAKAPPPPPPVQRAPEPPRPAPPPPAPAAKKAPPPPPPQVVTPPPPAPPPPAPVQQPIRKDRY